MTPKSLMPLTVQQELNLNQILRTLETYINSVAEPIQGYFKDLIAPAKQALTWPVPRPEQQAKKISALYCMVFPFLLKRYLRKPSSIPVNFYQQINIFIGLIGPSVDQEATINNTIKILTTCPISFIGLKKLCEYYNKHPINPKTVEFYSYLVLATAYAAALGREITLAQNDTLVILPGVSPAPAKTAHLTKQQFQNLLLLTSRMIEGIPQTEETGVIATILRSQCRIPQPAKRLRILTEMTQENTYREKIDACIPARGDSLAIKNQKFLALIHVAAPTASLAYDKAELVMTHFGANHTNAGAALRHIRSLAALEFDEIELTEFDRKLYANPDLLGLFNAMPSNIQARRLKTSNASIGITLDQFAAKSAVLCYQLGIGIYNTCVQAINRLGAPQSSPSASPTAATALTPDPGMARFFCLSTLFSRAAQTTTNSATSLPAITG